MSQVLLSILFNNKRYLQQAKNTSDCFQYVIDTQLVLLVCHIPGTCMRHRNHLDYKYITCRICNKDNQGDHQYQGCKDSNQKYRQISGFKIKTGQFQLEYLSALSQKNLEASATISS